MISVMTELPTDNFNDNRSTEMHTMHEALAREHLRELHRDARQRALYRELAAQRPRRRHKLTPSALRWHRATH